MECCYIHSDPVTFSTFIAWLGECRKGYNLLCSKTVWHNHCYNRTSGLNPTNRRVTLSDNVNLQCICNSWRIMNKLLPNVYRLTLFFSVTNTGTTWAVYYLWCRLLRISKFLKKHTDILSGLSLQHPSCWIFSQMVVRFVSQGLAARSNGLVFWLI